MLQTATRSIREGTHCYVFNTAKITGIFKEIILNPA
jgi:hypothetical protein